MFCMKVYAISMNEKRNKYSILLNFSKICQYLYWHLIYGGITVYKYIVNTILYRFVQNLIKYI